MAKAKQDTDVIEQEMPALPVEDNSKFLKTFDNGIKITSVRDVKKTKEGYDMTVLFDHIPVEVPFHALDNDSEPHGVWLHQEAAKGTFGDVAEYERPLPTKEDLQAELDKIWPDVVLGIATEDELSLAKNLRIQIKAMS